jgi:ribonuclease HI
MKLLLHTDGGARGNPGPAAIGWVLYDEDERIVDHGAAYVGETTNNVAEYEGLVRGLAAAKRHACDDLSVFMDSELVVKQVRAEYAVKAPHLRELRDRAAAALAAFENATITHVPRSHPRQARADQLVNETLDAQLRRSRA